VPIRGEGTNEQDHDAYTSYLARDYEAFWEAQRTADDDEAKARTDRVAFYRWLSGHHFWKICLTFIIDDLAKSATAFEQGAQEEGVEQLHRASILLRGTAAAMWYAANSPSVTYRDEVRPSMVRLARNMGAKSFSGVQSGDYSRKKVAHTRLREVLALRYGPDAQAWPHAVYHALYTFHQTDIHCEEQHVLIAFAKVGSEDPSEAQKMKQAYLPSGIQPMSAVEVLRHIAFP